MKMKFKRAIAGAMSGIITLTAIPFGSIAPQLSGLFASYSVSAAEKLTSGDFTYTLDKDDNAVICKYDESSGGQVEVPAEFDGHTVVTVGEDAFRENQNIESIELPDSVKTIEAGAFLNCSGLKTVKTGDGLESVGASAFRGCTSLSVVVLGKNISLIEHRSFEGTALESITIPDSVTEIGYEAFKNCGGLKEVTMSENLESLGSSAFANCEMLDGIILPDTLTVLGGDAFEGCTALKSIVIPEKTAEFPGNGHTGWCFNGCTGLESAVINNGVIPNGMFHSCESLKEVTINGNVEKIGYRTFENCKSLESISIPDSVTELGYESFKNCSSLESIKLSESLTVLESSMFFYCNSLKSIDIPDNVTALETGVFWGCESLNDVHIGKNVTDLGKNVFQECTGLESIVIPDSVEAIKFNSFMDCKNLREITIGRGVRTIDEQSFSGCKKLENVRIEGNVESIAYNALSSCESLECVSIADEDTFTATELILREIPYTADKTGIRDSEDKKLDRSLSDYHSSSSGVSASGLVGMEIKYGFKSDIENSVSNMSVELKIPSETEIENTSLTVNGEAVEYKKEKNGIYTIPVTDTFGSIEFSVSANSSVCLMSYAKMKYDINGESASEVIGIVNIMENLLTISVPERTASKTISVSGLTAPKKEISFFVDDEPAGSCVSSAAGGYKAEINLPDPEDGKIYKVEASASPKNNTEKKVAGYVIYDSSGVEITKFDMYFNDKKYDIIELDGKRPVIGWNGHSTYSFVVSFNDNSKVENVKVVSTQSGNETKSLRTVYDPVNDCFVASGFRGYVADNLTVEYDLKTDTSAVKGASAEPEGGYTIADTTNGSLIKINLPGISESLYYFTEYETGVQLPSDKIYTHRSNGETYYINDSEVWFYRDNGVFLGRELYTRNDDGTYDVYRSGVGMFNDTAERKELKDKAKLITDDSCFLDELEKSFNAAGYSEYFELAKKIKEIFEKTGIEPPKESPVTLPGGPSVRIPKLPEGSSLNDIINIIINIGGGEPVPPDIIAEIINYIEQITVINIIDIIWIGIIDPPQEPVSPTDPVEPTEPTEVTEPTEPTEATGLTDVTETNAATDLTEPAKPTEPSVPSGGNSCIPTPGCGTANKDEMEKLKNKIEKLEKELKDARNKQSKSTQNKLGNKTDKYSGGSEKFDWKKWLWSKFIKICKKLCPKYAIDPSGNVYEGVMSCKIEGAEAKIYYKDSENGEAVLWDAEEYDQYNPLYSDSDGYYGWDVPQGLWQVEVNKEGYETAYSDWLPVPPEQLEVHIGMVSKETPKVEFAAAYPDHIDIRFDQYTDIASVNADTVRLEMNGKTISFKAEPADAETSPSDSGLILAKTFRLSTDEVLSGSIDYTVSGTVNYAGKKMSPDCTGTADVGKEITGFEAEASAEVSYTNTTDVIIKAVPAEAAAGKKLILKADDSYMISIPGSVIFDDEGKAAIPVKALLPGETDIKYTVEGTVLEGTIRIVSGIDINSLKNLTSAPDTKPVTTETTSSETTETTITTVTTTVTSAVSASSSESTETSVPAETTSEVPVTTAVSTETSVPATTSEIPVTTGTADPDAPDSEQKLAEVFARYLTSRDIDISNYDDEDFWFSKYDDFNNDGIHEMYICINMHYGIDSEGVRYSGGTCYLVTKNNVEIVFRCENDPIYSDGRVYYFESAGEKFLAGFTYHISFGYGSGNVTGLYRINSDCTVTQVTADGRKKFDIYGYDWDSDGSREPDQYFRGSKKYTYINYALYNSNNFVTTIKYIFNPETNNFVIAGGDISGNGKIDLYDAIEIAKSLVGTRKFTDKEIEIADFNCDGKVNLYDAIDISKYMLMK